MKTVFIHDTVFVKLGDKYYAKDGLDDEVFKDYEKNFGEITIMARYEDMNENNKIYIKKENEIIHAKFICGKNFKEVIGLMKKNIPNYDFSILRVHSFISTVAFIYLKKNNIPYLCESVSCAWDCLWYHSIKGKVLAPFMLLITKYIIKHANYVTYVSHFLKRRYKPNNKAFNIVCSDVRLNNYKNNDYLNCKKELNLCTIANSDVKYKGHAYVIKAMSKLKSENINLKYYLIGGGTGSRLKKIAKKYDVINDIIFVGPIPHSKIFDYLKQNITIYVQPSNAESHGRVILEAESLGIPVIGSSTGGIPEIVNKEFVFKRKKVDDLYLKIKKIISEDNLKTQSDWAFENSKKFMPYQLSKKRSDFYNKIAQNLYKNSEFNNK